jgi:hypothetical protein
MGGDADKVGLLLTAYLLKDGDQFMFLHWFFNLSINVEP